MIDEDHFSSQATSLAYATQKNLKKRRSGLLADTACTAYLRLITGVAVRRREDNAVVRPCVD